MGKHINNLKILLIIIIAILSSCKTIEYQHLFFEGYDKLLLNKNRTFYQQIKTLTPVENLYGNWKAIGDTIFLDIKKPKAYFIEKTKVNVEELHFGDKDSIYFNIKLNNCSTNSGNVYLNGDLRESIFSYNDSCSNFKIKKQIIKEFYVFSSGFCFAGVEHKIIDTSANYFNIEMFSQFNLLKEANYIINPTVKYIKKRNKLIPVMHDSVRTEFALKRKFLRFAIR